MLTLTVTPDEGAATTHRVRVVRARRSSSSSGVGASSVFCLSRRARVFAVCWTAGGAPRKPNAVRLDAGSG